MDTEDFPGDVDENANADESDPMLNGDNKVEVNADINAEAEADFDRQLNDLNRSVPLSETMWPSPEEIPIQNDMDGEPENDMGGEPEDDPEVVDDEEVDAYADADVATEGSLDLEVEPYGGDIATEGSLDLDIGATEPQLPLGDGEEPGVEADMEVATEGSLDLNVGGNMEDDDEDADVFASMDKINTPSVTYDEPNTSDNSPVALAYQEPAPAHAQSLITQSNDDIQDDVIQVEPDASPRRDEENEITVLEPTTETKLLDHKGNGDVFDARIKVTEIRRGYPPPFPVGYDDENLRRGNWGHKMEFICAILCVVFSCYNLLQFPMLVYHNGGVIFLIPYMIALFVFILPLVLLEISLGQFTSSAFLTCWKFCPLLKGFGIGMLLHLFGLAFLNGTLASHKMYYIFTVFHPNNNTQLVYTTCDNPWNTDGCIAPPVVGNYSPTAPTDYSSFVDYEEVPLNLTSMIPEDEFYRHVVKMQSDTTDSLNAPVTHLMICLGMSWIIVFVLILFGMKSFGKAAYGLVGIHLLLLIVLLIRGALLEGAMDGIKILFWPDVSKLTSIYTWSAAFNAAFATFIPIAGILMALGSYNKFHNNCFLDSVVLILMSLFVSLLSAVAFFTYLGHGRTLNEESNLHSDFDSQGDRLCVMLASIFAKLPHGRIMSFLLFFFTFMSNINLQVVIALAIVVAFLDMIGCRHSLKAILPVSFITCLVCFGGGLLFVTPEGPHFIKVMDTFFLVCIPLIMAIILPIALTWIYGTTPVWKFLKFQRDIRAMVGCFPVVFQVIFSALEAFIVPPVAAVLLGFNLYCAFANLDITSEAYQGWHIAVAIIFAFVPLIIGFMCGAVIELCKYVTVYRYFTELFWLASLPLREWGPALEEIREEHGYPPLHEDEEIRKDRVQEVRGDEDVDECCDNANNANDNSTDDGIGYPTSPHQKQTYVYADGNGIETRVDPDATLPAGTPLLGLSLCSHETTL